jgi:hypothetical protein
MTAKALDKAVAKAADQEGTGESLDAYIDVLQVLRAMLDEGIRSLDDGHGRKIDMEEIIARARADEI